MIAIIDYDAGNIRSVEHALRHLGQDVTITREREALFSSDKVILPGVGNFGDAMRKLRKYGLVEPVREIAEKEVPLLGICLGEQLFFEASEESPGEEGLGFAGGHCLRFPDGKDKIPQIGWNSLLLRNGGKLFRNIPDGSYVYFVHSYYASAKDPSIVKAVTPYAGVEAVAAIEKGNLFACQFHPEKSGEVGLAILSNFLSV